MPESWYPLPFPKCPGCSSAWVSCFHKTCGGEMELEPFHRKVRCTRCHERWNLMVSAFFCTCDRQFTASEAEAACAEVVRATRELFHELERKKQALRRIDQTRSASLNGFFALIAESVGGAAGFLVGRLLRWIQEVTS